MCYGGIRVILARLVIDRTLLAETPQRAKPRPGDGAACVLAAATAAAAAATTSAAGRTSASMT